MKVIPNLHFNGECEKAIKHYEQAFQARRLMLIRYKDAGETTNEKALDYVYHAEIMIGDQRVLLNDYAYDIPMGQNVSLLISFDSVDEVKRTYEILKAGAEIIAPLQELSYSSGFASLIDRYGIRWELMKEN